jgi:lauroyl/myristoyl acyltransferase
VTEHGSLADALTDVERPKAGRVQPTGQTLAVRLYGSPLLHRAVPTAVALGLGAARGWLEWRTSPRRRAEALRQTETIRRLPQGSAKTRRYARRRIVEDALQAELQWRPWLWRAMPIEGIEHLDAARARSGGGVIVGTVHIGPILGAPHALAARGIKLYVSGGQWGGEPVAYHGRRGRWTTMQDRWMEEAGCRWVHRGGSYRVLKALLERGEVCFTAVDVPGTTPLEFGGRRVCVRTGVASLALEAQVPVVPTVTLRRGHRQVVVMSEPVDPSRYDNPLHLTQHLLRTLEPFLLQQPEQVQVNVFQLWAASA